MDDIVNIVNRMLSDYKSRSDKEKTDSELHGKPLEKRLQKKIPWNVSSSIILLSGVIALAGFIFYSSTGDPYFESSQLHTEDDSKQKVELLASIQQSPANNENVEHDEVDIGIDEREQVSPDEILPPGVLSGSMPPLLQKVTDDIKPKEIAKVTKHKDVAIAVNKPPSKNKLVEKADKLIAKSSIKPKQISTPINEVASEKKNVAIDVKKSPKTVIAKNDIKKSEKLKLEPKVKKDNKVNQKKIVKALAISEAAEVKTIDKKIVPLTDEQFAQKSYQTAMEYINDGQSVKAASMLEGALQKQPSHLLARKALTGILIEDKAWERAEQHLKSALVHNPESKLVPMWLARIYLELNRSGEAVKVLESRERYAKGDDDYYALLAMAFQKSDLNLKAIDAYKQAIKIDNYNSRWWFGLATVFEMVEKWTDAYSAYNQAINTAQLSSNMNNYAKERLNYVKMQLELLAEMNE